MPRLLLYSYRAAIATVSIDYWTAKNNPVVMSEKKAELESNLLKSVEECPTCLQSIEAFVTDLRLRMMFLISITNFVYTGFSVYAESRDLPKHIQELVFLSSLHSLDISCQSRIKSSLLATTRTLQQQHPSYPL